MQVETETVRPPSLFRAALLALGGIQGFLGLYALISPLGFYEDFPFGRGWVGLLPSYSEHLVRDVGGLFLLSAAVLIAAGIYLERRLVAVALGSFLLFSVPHTIFHFLNFEPFDTPDVIANVIGLGSQVLIPVALLVVVARERPDQAPGGAGARRMATEQSASGSSGSRGPRIEGVGDGSRNPLVRYAFRSSRKHGGGQVMDPIRVFAHNPTVMAGYGALELATERSSEVPERLKHLAVLRTAMLCGCEWCLDYGSAVSTAANVSEEDLRALPTYGDGNHFDELERVVLDYASGMSRTPAEITDSLFARLRDHFNELQLVELTNVIALENYRARFNWAFGLAGQGFSDGSYCVRPEAGAATEAPAAP